MALQIRFPGGKPKTLTLSYDDGVDSDIRLIEILNKYGLKATFNVNSGIMAEEGAPASEPGTYRRMSRSEMLKLYTDSGHEVAVHTLTHPFTNLIAPQEILHEVIEDRKNLEEMFGGIIRGMAYPMGTPSYTKEVDEILQASGIAYARTTESTESFFLPDNWLKLPATCHHNNPRLMELAEQFLNMWYGGTMFYLWGHSYEFVTNNNWEVIEEFAKKMSGHDDIWYATNIEIYDYVKAFRSLQMNAECTLVYNPTVIDVWGAARDGKIIHVPAGQMVELK